MKIFELLKSRVEIEVTFDTFKNVLCFFIIMSLDYYFPGIF